MSAGLTIASTEVATRLDERDEFLIVLQRIANLWGDSTDDQPKFLSCDTVAKLATGLARDSIANIQGGGTMTTRHAKWLDAIEQAYREGFADACDKFPDWTHTDPDRHWKASVSATYAANAAKAAAAGLKRTAVPALVLLALLLPAFASAQARLTLPATVYAGAAALDLWSTADCLSVGCHEHNPLIGWAEPHGTAPMLAFGVALESAGYLALTHLISPHHPRLARATIYGAALAHGLLGVRNLQQARGQRICNRQDWGTRC